MSSIVTGYYFHAHMKPFLNLFRDVFLLVCIVELLLLSPHSICDHLFRSRRYIRQGFWRWPRTRLVGSGGGWGGRWRGRGGTWRGDGKEMGFKVEIWKL